MALRQNLSQSFWTSNRQDYDDSENNLLMNRGRARTAPPRFIQHRAHTITHFVPRVVRWQLTNHSSSIPLHVHSIPIRRETSHVPSGNSWNYAYRYQHILPTYSLKHYKVFKTAPVKPIWSPPSRYKHQRPASFSPETKPRQVIREPVWSPPSQYKHKQPKSFSPEMRPRQVIREPIWSPPSHYKHQRPASFSPETKPRQVIREPVWQPNGKVNHKPVTYFDPAHLRWSLQDMSRSMRQLRI
jgi:hypothetical protein